MMIKPKNYLENSAISMYYSDDDPYRRDCTLLFWKDIIPLFDAYISGFVVDEIEATSDHNLRMKMGRLVRDLKVLEINEEIIR
jgi:hypothetical protein